MTGVAQWVGHCPANQKVTVAIPGQGSCLGCGPGPHLGLCERQHIDLHVLDVVAQFGDSASCSALTL